MVFVREFWERKIKGKFGKLSIIIFSLGFERRVRRERILEMEILRFYIGFFYLGKFFGKIIGWLFVVEMCFENF